jgi:hypothetical protein
MTHVMAEIALTNENNLGVYRNWRTKHVAK